MSSLFSMLNLGAGAISAHTAGVSVASNNAANADTEGYSRQRVELRSLLGSGGVSAGGVDRFGSAFLGGRLRDTAGTLAMSKAFAAALMSIEAEITAPNADVSVATSALFDSFSALSVAPSDSIARGAAVEAAENLAATIRRQAASLSRARADADQRIRDQTSEASKLAFEIATANKAIQTSDDPVLRDRRDAAAEQLAALVGGDARIDGDGFMRFVLPGGAVVVDGTRAASFQGSTDPANGGMARLDLVDGASRVDVTGQIESGAIGGELQFRDSAVVSAANDLDQLAFDLSTQINAVHQAGAGSDGVSGRDLFAAPTQVAGAAAAMAVDAPVAADSSLLAAGATGAGPTDNSNALALAAMRDQPLAGGGTRTFIDAGIDIAAGVGQQAARASGENEMLGAVRDHLDSVRDSIAGVSIQEELTRLSQFQHGVEAATRFISTVDGLLGTIIESL
jgi:flagellar hook-associated protein 1 FlgK